MLLYVSLVFVFLTPSSGFHVFVSVLAKRLAGKSVSEMTYFVSTGRKTLLIVKGVPGGYKFSLGVTRSIGAVVQ